MANLPSRETDAEDACVMALPRSSRHRRHLFFRLLLVGFFLIRLFFIGCFLVGVFAVEVLPVGP